MTLSQKRPVPVAFALGILGGATIIVWSMIIGTGPKVMVAYAALVVASFVTVRVARWPAFSQRFLAAFLAFMTATALVVLYLIAFADGVRGLPSWEWFAVVPATMAVIGGALSAAVAYLADLGQTSS